jgi:hypothetical protein
MGRTHKENVLKSIGLPQNGYSLEELAEASGVAESTLQKVYNRGIGAYKTNPTSVRMKGSYEKNISAPLNQKLPKEQWAMARVYSFLDENPKHDQDLRGGSLEDTYSRWLEKLRAGRSEEIMEEVVELFMEDDGAEGDAFRDLVVEYADEHELESADVVNSPNHLLALLMRGLNEIQSKPRPPPAGGSLRSDFKKQLRSIDYNPDDYIRDVRKKATKYGYDPRCITFANDSIHKLQIETPTGQIIKFGRVGYGDFLIWKHIESRGEAPKGKANTKRRVFLKSHGAIRGSWKSDQYSPNNLAIRLLW